MAALKILAAGLFVVNFFVSLYSLYGQMITPEEFLPSCDSSLKLWILLETCAWIYAVPAFALQYYKEKHPACMPFFPKIVTQILWCIWGLIYLFAVYWVIPGTVWIISFYQDSRVYEAQNTQSQSQNPTVINSQHQQQPPQYQNQEQCFLSTGFKSVFYFYQGFDYILMSIAVVMTFQQLLVPERNNNQMLPIDINNTTANSLHRNLLPFLQSPAEYEAYIRRNNQHWFASFIRNHQPFELDETAMNTPTFEINKMCSICHEEFQLSDSVLKLPRCKHRFHLTCIQNWLPTKPTCPNCNLVVSEDIYLPNQQQQLQQQQTILSP